MKTILVTGGAGFIGSNYLNEFVPLYSGIKFINVDSLTYAGNLANVTVSALPNYVFEQVDITDAFKLENLFDTYKPEGIIHFAAESHVDKSISDPDAFIKTNIGGTNNLLRLAVKHSIIRFHQVSTDEVYGSLGEEDSAFTESSQLAPNNPYSASKAAGDLLVRSYYKTFGLDAVITRCSNNYGPNQDDTKMIPLFIKKLLAGERVPLYGDGLHVRDWLHVSDHVRAIDLVFHKGKSGEIYNVGGDNELTNIVLVNKLLKLTNRNSDAIEFVTDRKGHDRRYAIDASKIQNELGWKPVVTFEEGIADLLALSN